MHPTTLFGQAKQAYEESWKPAWSSNQSTARLESHFKAALRSADQVISHAKDLKSSGNLSDKGFQEAIRDFAIKHAVPAITETGEAIWALGADLAARRAKLALPAIDPTDMAGAIRRSEMRSWFLNMGSLKSMAYLMGDTVDEVMAAAVLEMPPQLSGLSANQQDQVRDHVSRIVHRSEFKILDDIQEALDLTRAALSSSIYHLRQEVQFGQGDLPQFDKAKVAA